MEVCEPRDHVSIVYCRREQKKNINQSGQSAGGTTAHWVGGFCQALLLQRDRGPARSGMAHGDSPRSRALSALLSGRPPPSRDSYAAIVMAVKNSQQQVEESVPDLDIMAGRLDL